MKKNIIYNSNVNKLKQVKDSTVALTLATIPRSVDVNQTIEPISNILNEIVRVTIPGGKICVIHWDIMVQSRIANYIRTLDSYLYGRIILENPARANEENFYNTAHGEYKSYLNFDHLNIYRKGKKQRSDKSAEDGRFIVKNDWKGMVHGLWKYDPDQPSAFFENCIKMYSFPDDIVLDPFMQNDSTLVSAKSLGRNYIGYCEDMEIKKQTETVLSKTIYASKPTYQIMDRISGMKQLNVQEIPVNVPDIERLKSAKIKPSLRKEINKLLSSDQDIIETCENYPAFLIDGFTQLLQQEYFIEQKTLMSLIEKYQHINLIHIILQLGGWDSLKKEDQQDIEKYFKDKGLNNLLSYTVFELKEFENGKRLKTINGWRNRRLQKIMDKKMKNSPKGKGAITIMGDNVIEKDGLKIVHGDPKLLLIAPHGVNRKPMDDNYTDKITLGVAEQLGCCAIVNDSISRKDCDFNLISDASSHKTFLPEIKELINKDNHTLVVWVHGIANDSIKEEAENKKSNFNGKPEELHALIGYGQGPNPKKRKNNKEDIKSRYTAEKDTVENFRDGLCKNGMNTILTRDDAPNFRGRAHDNMNQWLLNQGYKLSEVESIQLEIKEEGFRKKKDIGNTINLLSSALTELVGSIDVIETEVVNPENLPAVIETEADDELVERAYNELKGIIVGHVRMAMLDAGLYIIREFYGNDYDLARKKKSIRGKSLRKLIEKLQEGKGNAPSKTWIYDAVNLAVDERQFSEISVYGNLGHYQKVLLTRVKDPEIKKQLIVEAQDYTVDELRKRIAQAKKKNISKISLDNLPTRKALIQLDEGLLKRHEQEAKDLIYFHKKKSATYESAFKKISSVIEDKEKVNKGPKGKEERASGFYEWTKPGNIVNICFGCSNNCVYCFNKAPSYRRGFVKKGRWRDEIIRKDQVDAPRKLFNGRVAFPTTHDITTKNIDSYITVLGKLLKAGNEILIVSKPKYECIKRVCEVSEYFKDEIMFRFTIGAKSDKVLALWEPNAPSYKERKQSLIYAYENGFNTSVSVEPMLDSPNIDALVKDLLPYVNDALWIGKMNHIGDFSKTAKGDLKEAITAIEENQTDEKIKEIYARHKDNPKIKWKDSIKKIVGIPAPPAMGMDV